MPQSNEERFRFVYEHHVDAVRAYARRRIAADAVDDVVADVFLVCWRKLDDVPREPLPWLYAVARKTLANARRADERRRVIVREGEPVSWDAPPPDGDADLARAFDLLTEDDREVLRLVAWEQLPLADAARVLGCSNVACRVRLHRARRRLSAHLAAVAGAPAAGTPPPRPEGATR